MGRLGADAHEGLADLRGEVEHAVTLLFASVANRWAAEQIIDLERYPIHDVTGTRREEVIAEARAGLHSIGAAELPGFLSPTGLQAVLDDAVTVEPAAHRHAGPATAYLGLPDTEQPEGHPRRWIGASRGRCRRVGPVRPRVTDPRLYEDDAVMAFLGEIIDRGRLYPYADPLGALNLATMGAGDQLQWHFDQTDFVVSLALRDAEVGGDFEVVPRIRTEDDERYDRSRAVLAGRSGPR